MSLIGGLISELIVDAAFSPDGPATAEPRENGGFLDEEGWEVKDEVLKKMEEDGKRGEEAPVSSAHLEPSTLPWPGDKDRRPLVDGGDGACSEKGVTEEEEEEERDTGISAGSQDLSEKQSEAEADRKCRWRESMPEGERWRDEEDEPRRDDLGDGHQADDEEDDSDEDEESHWLPEKAALSFTPKVTIVNPLGKESPEEAGLLMEKEAEPQPEPGAAAVHIYPDYMQEYDKDHPCTSLCSLKVGLIVSTVSGALLFPLLVWIGHRFLPLDVPLLRSAPLRVVYTIRCAFFAIIPVLLGVLVQGVARMRHGELQPLFQSQLVNREVAVHWHYVNESVALFLFYFLQLAVMASYLSQDLVKLVPLLTILFVFGRLIYWLGLSLNSSVRGLGFSFSFFPNLVMVGVNLYYICSSGGPESVFDVAPPTTAPPMPRWWG